jgi:4-hydroxy-tetrahydrodipicolinate reductase
VKPKQILETQICVNAATGRMGQQIIHQIVESTSCELSAALCRSAHPYRGKSVRGGHKVKYSNDIDAGLFVSQVLIDFSLPSVSIALLEKAISTKTPVLIGTTGFDDKELQLIDQASKKIPVLLAPNTSIGVNTTLSLIEKATQLLGKSADIEIIDTHHKHKLDAPSGTALKIGEVICDTLETDLSETVVYDRSQRSAERSQSEIGISVVRAGSVVGEHKVMFALENELISIEHKAQSRQCFAEGAVKAACWLAKQPNGLYSMKDFLNL